MRLSYKYKSLAWIVLVIILFALAAWCKGGFTLKGAAAIFGLCFLCELVDSGLGMGYGTILTPTLLIFGYDAHDIVPTVLLTRRFLSGFTASFFHNEIKNVELGFRGKDFRPAAILAGGSIAGVTAGVFLALNLPKNLLSTWESDASFFLSGCLVLLLSSRVIKYRNWKMVLLASVASFNKAVSGGGYGPLVTSGQILSGVQSKSSVGITSFAEAFTCLLAVSLFLLKGGWINLALFIPMGAGALISVPFSVLAINKAGENFLKIIIGGLTMIMGAGTIYKALG